MPDRRIDPSGRYSMPLPLRLSSLNSPTYFPPSGNVEVPSPLRLPSFNSPAYLWPATSPSGNVKLPCPIRLPSFKWPAWFRTPGSVLSPAQFVEVALPYEPVHGGSRLCAETPFTATVSVDAVKQRISLRTQPPFSSQPSPRPARRRVREFFGALQEVTRLAKVRGNDLE